MPHLLRFRSQNRYPIRLKKRSDFLLHLQNLLHFRPLDRHLISRLMGLTLAQLTESHRALAPLRFVQLHLNLIDKTPHSVSPHQFHQFYLRLQLSFYHVDVNIAQYQYLLAINRHEHLLRKVPHPLLQSLIAIVLPFFLLHLLLCHQYHQYQSQ